MSNETNSYGKILGNRLKDQFLREAYIQLYSAIDVPSEIDEAVFSEVAVDEIQLVKQTNTYEVDYSCEIGYDRQEPYVTTESYREKVGDRWVTKQRAVTKYKTVTDWQPHSGSAEKTKASALTIDVAEKVDIGDLSTENKYKYNDYYFDPESVLLITGTDSFEECSVIPVDESKFLPINDDQYIELFSSCAYRAEASVRYDLPGDKNRNFSAKRNLVDAKTNVYTVDRYKVAFEIDGQKHFIKQFSNESTPKIYCSHKYVDDVTNDIQSSKESYLKFDPIVKQNALLKKISLFGGIGLFALGFMFTSIGVVSLIGIVGIVLAFVLFGKKLKKRKEEIEKEFKEKQNSHNKEKQAAKIELLNAKFSKLGMAPLSEEELKNFRSKKEHFATKVYEDCYEARAKAEKSKVEAEIRAKAAEEEEDY